MSDFSDFIIFTCADSHQLPAACCALLSVARRVQPEPVSLLLIGLGLDVHDEVRLKQFSQFHAVDIRLVPFDVPSRDEDIPDYFHYDMPGLHFDAYIPRGARRVLFIDPCMQATRPLKRLVEADLKGRAVGAVEDCVMAFPREARRLAEAIGLIPSARLFNAGLMLFDWQKVVEQGLFERARKDYLKRLQYGVTMGSVFNYAFADDWLPLHPRWNIQDGMVQAVGRFGILNFDGAKKPWHARPSWLHLGARQFYIDTLRGTGWADFCRQASTEEILLAFAKHLASPFGRRYRRQRILDYFGPRKKGIFAHRSFHAGARPTPY